MPAESSIVQRPLPSFPSLAVRLSGRGLVYISSREWRHGQGKLSKCGCHVNHKQLRPHNLYWSATILSRKIAAHKDDFVALYKTVGRTSRASTIGCCCQAKPIHGPFKRHRVQALALACCCHAKLIHGACKRHTVHVHVWSLQSLFH